MHRSVPTVLSYGKAEATLLGVAPTLALRTHHGSDRGPIPFCLTKQSLCQPQPFTKKQVSFSFDPDPR